MLARSRVHFDRWWGDTQLPDGAALPMKLAQRSTLRLSDKLPFALSSSTRYSTLRAHIIDRYILDVKMSDQPTLSQLQQPANVKDILSQQEKDLDCTPCRLMGTTSPPPYTMSPFPNIVVIQAAQPSPVLASTPTPPECPSSANAKSRSYAAAHALGWVRGRARYMC